MPYTVINSDNQNRESSCQFKNDAQLGRDRKMEDRRRRFLERAVVAITTLAASSLLLPPRVAAAQKESARSSVRRQGKHFAMVMDMRKYVECDACVASCKAENNVPLGVFRTWVEKHEEGISPNIKLVFVPKLSATTSISNSLAIPSSPHVAPNPHKLPNHIFVWLEFYYH